MPGLRPEIRTRAGLFSGRHVLQLSPLHPTGPGDRAAALAMDRLAFRQGDAGRVLLLPAAGARGDPMGPRNLDVRGPLLRPGPDHLNSSDRTMPSDRKSGARPPPPPPW